MKIREYRIAVSTGAGPFSIEVNNMLKEGWYLYGHPMVGGNGVLYQAMIKTEDNQPPQQMWDYK